MLLLKSAEKIFINVMNMVISLEENPCHLFDEDMFMHTNRSMSQVGCCQAEKLEIECLNSITARTSSKKDSLNKERRHCC